jgi:hypothetical protein
MIWLFLVLKPFFEVVPNGTTQGWVCPIPLKAMLTF